MGVWADVDAQKKDGDLRAMMERWQRGEVLLYVGEVHKGILMPEKWLLLLKARRSPRSIEGQKSDPEQDSSNNLKIPFIRSKINLAGCPPLLLPASL